jgi:hypothetical protein
LFRLPLNKVLDLSLKTASSFSPNEQAQALVNKRVLTPDPFFHLKACQSRKLLLVFHRQVPDWNL